MFMSSKPPHLYGVLGLEDPIRDLTAGAHLPILVRAALLPFQDLIIYDGILSMYGITFGRGIRTGLSRTCSRLKENERIIEGLFDIKGEEPIRTNITRKLPPKPVPDWGSAVRGADRSQCLAARLLC